MYRCVESYLEYNRHSGIQSLLYQALYNLQEDAGALPLDGSRIKFSFPLLLIGCMKLDKLIKLSESASSSQNDASYINLDGLLGK